MKTSAFCKSWKKKSCDIEVGYTYHIEIWSWGHVVLKSWCFGNCISFSEIPNSPAQNRGPNPVPKHSTRCTELYPSSFGMEHWNTILGGRENKDDWVVAISIGEILLFFILLICLEKLLYFFSVISKQNLKTHFMYANT